MKKIMIIGVALLGSGFIFSLIFGIFAYNEFVETIQQNSIHHELTYEADRFTEIELYFDNHSIEVIPSEADQIKIDFLQFEHETLTIEDETKLFIKMKTNKFILIPFWNLFCIIDKLNKVQLELPKIIFDKLTLQSKNGSISVTSLHLTNLDIKTTNGGVTVKNMQSNTLNAIMTNGGIRIEDSAISVIKAETTNGGIRIDNTTSSENVSVKTTNGKVKLTNLTVTNLTSRTTNGSIYIDIIGERINYKMELATKNGRLKIDQKRYSKSYYHDSSNLNLILASSVNGNVELNFKN